MTEDIKKSLDLLPDLPESKEDFDKLSEEEKQEKINAISSFFESQKDNIGGLFETFRKRQVKKEKISKIHLYDDVRNFKKITYSILHSKGIESIEDTTRKVCDQIDEMCDLEDKDKSYVLRSMFKKSLNNCKPKFIESIEEAKEQCESQEELEDSTSDFYTSFFNMVFSVIETKYIEDQKKMEEELKNSQKQTQSQEKEDVTDA